MRGETSEPRRICLKANRKPKKNGVEGECTASMRTRERGKERKKGKWRVWEEKRKGQFGQGENHSYVCSIGKNQSQRLWYALKKVEGMGKGERVSGGLERKRRGVYAARG